MVCVNQLNTELRTLHLNSLINIPVVGNSSSILQQLKYDTDNDKIPDMKSVSLFFDRTKLFAILPQRIHLLANT